jgi:hypothetical protein
MNNQIVLAVMIFVLSTFEIYAGNLSNNQWQAANCGSKPTSPQINTKSVDSYNQSIKDVNTWQIKAQEYYNCIVKEANEDNAAIAKSANSAQEEFKTDVNRIQKEAEAGKTIVEKN